jgi:hypothetical protein
MHAAAPPEDITPVEQILVLDPVQVVGEVSSNSTRENSFFFLQMFLWFNVQLLKPSWNALNLPSAQQKRGRPRNHN